MSRKRTQEASAVGNGSPTPRARSRRDREAPPPGDAGTGAHLLEVAGLNVAFATERGLVEVVRDVSFQLDRGETLAVVGESGSGKSVTAKCVMGTLPQPPGIITGGEIRYRGENLLALDRKAIRKLRGRHLALISQDALTSLNPTLSVGFQIGEMFRVHEGASRAEAHRKSIELLERVEIPAAARRVGDYPHQFSGGMRQRVMIAMALALNPAVIIADEPTTALDVTVEAQIMQLLKDIQAESHLGLVLITHDLALVSGVADRVAVMYGGRVMETGPVPEIFAAPAHPYTRGLLASIPSQSRSADELTPIAGAPPNPMRMPPGCPFHPRCEHAVARCEEGMPEPLEVAHGGVASCWRVEELA